MSVLSDAIDLDKYSIDNEVRGISVKSDDYLAKQIYTSGLLDFFYPICFWLVILGTAGLFIGVIYYDLFVPFSKKERSLLKQLNDLRKKEAQKKSLNEEMPQTEK